MMRGPRPVWRHNALWLATACVIFGLSTPTPVVYAQSGSAQSDTVAIVRAVWDFAIGVASAAPVGHVAWLWTPERADSGRVIPISAEVRAALVRQAVPASVQRPAGDDTVVFRLTDWQFDSAGAVVQMTSAWTEVLGRGALRCRAGSVNVERIRVRRQGLDWVAARVGPIIHGDRVCVPLR